MSNRTGATAISIAIVVSACHHAGANPSPAPPVTPASAAAPASTHGATDVLVSAGPTPIMSPRNGRAFATFHPALPLVRGPFTCSKPGPISNAMLDAMHFPHGAVTYSASFQNAAGAKASIVVTVDSAGNLLSMGERRGELLLAGTQPGLTPQQQRDSLKAAIDRTPSTTISLNLLRDQAIVSNRGGDLAPESITGPVAVIENLPQLDKPLTRAREVAAVCWATSHQRG